MDTIPGSSPMENPPQCPLAGLDPADLLKQGAAEDTFMEGAALSFQPPSLDELAAIFPQFEILELIGQGGMGAVYKVRQKDLDRIVALKILPPAIGQSAEFSNRFTREAKALAKLNHPGIVTLHEFGQASSAQALYFILMEFVDGVNLAQLMKTGRISPREALAIVPQICDALQFAHDQGIVHRDIKPENILLDRLGRVKVADFGIAKVVAAATEDHGHECPRPLGGGDIPVPTLSGKIIGTPQYMAPEQIDHPSEVDHRADIYALGVVFYQMLTGELPGREFQAPSKKVHIDVRLDEIVMRAMEKQPELRYQTAHELRTMVDGIQSPAPAPSPRRRGMLRRWWWVFLIIFPLGLLLGLAAGWAWAYIIPKAYQTEAVIEVRPASGAGTTIASTLFATEFEKIRSRKSLMAVAEQLELSNKWMVGQASAVEKLQEIIQTRNISGTDLISISVRHTNRQDAVDILKAVVRNYQQSFPGKVVVHEWSSEPANPVSPNVGLILVIGSLLGLVLSPLFALIPIAVLQRLFPESPPAAALRKGAVTQNIATPESKPSPSKKLKWMVAAILVTAALWVAMKNSGRTYPASSLSSDYRAPILGRIEFKYIHPDAKGGSKVFYPVKKWGDTQWWPRQQTSFSLKGDRKLQVKTRVNATGPGAPVAMVTTSSDNSHWETRELKLDGSAPLRQLVFSNGLCVEIQWSPAASSVGDSEPPDPIQQGVMKQASKFADEMHPVSPIAADRPGTMRNAEVDSAKVANQYLDLITEVAALEGSGLGSSHPVRIVAEAKLANFKSQHPTLPDAECRRLAAERLLARYQEKSDLFEKGVGTRHLRAVSVQAQIDALEQISAPGSSRPRAEILAEVAQGEGISTSANATPTQVTILIQSENEVTLDEVPISLADLAGGLAKLTDHNKDVSVAIRSAPEVPYARVVEILEICKKGGVWNLSFGSDKRGIQTPAAPVKSGETEMPDIPVIESPPPASVPEN
jgi:tRNA A-37 threonylcarbamoyl transferase component Bud32/biopolymer transport protein ExbD/capsular polysaccharide biosynthesis protein